MSRQTEWTLIGVIVVIYLALASQYALRVPDWQAPDEPAHYNYVRQIATEQRIPVLEMGDWQQSYQEALVGSGFDPALRDRLDTLQYEDHQPPLYYLLQAPIYVVTGGELVALRLWSAVMGAGIILATWGTLRALLPRWPVAALAGAGFVGFLPQHVSILASVSNDALAGLLAALTLLTVVRYLDNPPGRRQPHPVWIGVLVGLALLTKTTIYFLGGIAVLAVLLRWRRTGWTWRIAASHLAAVLIPALILGGIWWARNLHTYGGVDFAGLERHDAVTVGQPRTDEYIDVMYGGSMSRYLRAYAETTFRSFWGQFGWMQVTLPDRDYRLLALFTGLLIAGFAYFLLAAYRRAAPSPAQLDAGVILAVSTGAVLAAYLVYNLDFIQFQGRYLYPALVPVGLVVGTGLAGWTLPLRARLPLVRWLPLVVTLLLAVYAWYALDAYLVPTLPAW